MSAVKSSAAAATALSRRDLETYYKDLNGLQLVMLSTEELERKLEGVLTYGGSDKWERLARIRRKLLEHSTRCVCAVFAAAFATH